MRLYKHTIGIGKWMLLSDGYNMNLSDTSHITNKGNDYFFIVSDMDYIVRFYHLDRNNWSIKFGIHKNGKPDITMLNKLPISLVKQVMINVAKSLVSFLKSVKPVSIRYDTDTKSRKTSYLRLINLLFMKQEVLSYYLDVYNDSIHYIVRNGHTREDIFN